MSILDKLFGSHSDREVKRILPVVDRIEALGDEYAATACNSKRKHGKNEERLARKSYSAESRLRKTADHDIVGEGKGKFDKVLQGNRQSEPGEDRKKVRL